MAHILFKKLIILLLSVSISFNAYARTKTPAEDIPVTDAGEYFTGTNVETILAELGSVGPGSGDITSVGDCASGASLDGSSDGGTWIRLYDGNSHYIQISPQDVVSNITLTLPSITSTLIYSGGAFHDGFSDFVANEHIDWTAESAGTIHSTNYVDNDTTYTVTDTTTIDMTLTVQDIKADLKINSVDSDHYIDDSIDDVHLNLGVGANQISASDMPDEDVGDITIVSGVYTVDPGSIHDLTIAVKEENTSAIVKGQAVYVSGSAGVGQVLVGLINNTDSTKIRALGLAAEAIAQDAPGTVRIRGELSGVDTLGSNAVNPNGETWLAGDLLYCTNGSSGGLTSVRPTSGRIIRAAYSLVGSHNNDTLLVLPFENPNCLAAASEEDICVRMGDNDGAKKVCFKDYANNDVACVNSNGIYTCAGLTIGSAVILEAELEILDGATLTTTQINYLNASTGTTGTTSSNLVFSTSPTIDISLTGSYLTASEILITDADKKIVSAPVATYPSLTELSYVKGLPGSIDTLLNTKAPSDSPTFTTAFTATGLINDGDMASTADVMLSAVGIVIDGGGSAITTGIKGEIEVPFNCDIVQATLILDQSGSIVIDVWKDSYANYPPDNADSITSAAPPTVTTATKSQDSTLTDWTTAISAGDILRFNVDSITTAERATLILKVKKN